ncbi:MAG: metal ABC transporter ATP-binding protein [Synechococcaceae cyanobacterium SM2_3_1]|nr:metal ABC transporter ATP-binding protein [Synechococcaceae cyanobacterium SM2_3_1]
MNQSVLVVDSLTVKRGSAVAVEGVSFQLQAGSNTAVIGPNGAGKSTLVQSILGILPFQEGSISVLGTPMTANGHLPTSIREQIAYLPQSFQFDPSVPMTVAEFVGLGWGSLGPQWPWAHRQARLRGIRQALDKVNALHLLHRSLAGLSGGETKRVLLAYCLVWPRRLLILDEAPAGLDLQAEGDFYQLLEELRRSLGWAILQVSHDLDMVSRHCDHVLCLRRTLLCQGPPAQTLSTETLTAAYGPEFIRYHHRCH